MSHRCEHSIYLTLPKSLSKVIKHEIPVRNVVIKDPATNGKVLFVFIKPTYVTYQYIDTMNCEVIYDAAQFIVHAKDIADPLPTLYNTMQNAIQHREHLLVYISFQDVDRPQATLLVTPVQSALTSRYMMLDVITPYSNSDNVY